MAPEGEPRADASVVTYRRHKKDIKCTGSDLSIKPVCITYFTLLINPTSSVGICLPRAAHGRLPIAAIDGQSAAARVTLKPHALASTSHDRLWTFRRFRPNQQLHTFTTSASSSTLHRRHLHLSSLYSRPTTARCDRATDQRLPGIHPLVRNRNRHSRNRSTKPNTRLSTSPPSSTPDIHLPEINHPILPARWRSGAQIL